MITRPPPIERLLQPGGLLPGKSFPSFSSSTPSENKGRFLPGVGRWHCSTRFLHACSSHDAAEPHAPEVLLKGFQKSEVVSGQHFGMIRL